MEKIKTRPKGSVRWHILGILVAMETLMSFSFLGYLHIEPISITTAYIPVVLAGLLLGPLESTLLGMVFGLASMWKASAHYVVNVDRMFSPFSSGQPLESVLLSVGSRMAFGLLVGLLFYAIRNTAHQGIWNAVVAFFAPMIHSALVYGVMGLCFPQAGFTIWNTLYGLHQISNLLTYAATMVIVIVVWHVHASTKWKTFLSQVEMAKQIQVQEPSNRLLFWGIVVGSLCALVAVAIYFVHRTDVILNQNGIFLSDENYSDLVHLQLQFLAGILSLTALILIFWIFYRRYAAYASYKAKIDALTGAMTRKAFFQASEQALKSLMPQNNATGYFVMVDLDWFKEINDQYGHPEGDRALKAVARGLREIFGSEGLVGRVGGDEFAVFIYTPMARGELEVHLRHFLDYVHKVHWKERKMSCSIGALPVTEKCPVEDLYRDADELLYQAKDQGRNQYVIGVPAQSACPEQVNQEIATQQPLRRQEWIG